MLKTVTGILKAHIYDVVSQTQLDTMPQLSEAIGHQVYIKREDLQPVFSFKIRGAYNKIRQLSEEEKERGIIASSAGNHAQGVAYSAKKLGVNAVIVMPKTTPQIKVTAVKRLGSKIVLHGDSYDDAYQKALEISESTNRVFIHPYDDDDVIAGQGTIAQEIIRQMKVLPDVVFIPVGGGGLIAGMSAYIKYLYPHIKVIGVEPDDACNLYEALKANKRVILSQVGIFADGVAVKQIGKKTFEIAKQCVDEVITISTDELCAAIKDIYDDIRCICEPAGALAVAGAKKWAHQNKTEKNKHLVTIASGANINFHRLRHISERAEYAENKEAVFAVTLPEKPGSFKHLCKTLGNKSITEFNYRYADSEKAHVFIGVSIHDESEKKEIQDALQNEGFPILDLTQNELAKLHGRYMVGGKSDKSIRETLYRFQFPERPGALAKFLNTLGSHWNISLFHYRNHGAAFGRVLVGLQVPKNEEAQLKQYFKKLGYPYTEETQNVFFELFL